MNIGVDIRCLMDKNRTGVGEYTFGMLNTIFGIDLDRFKQLNNCLDANQYFLFYNSWADVSKNIPQWKQENVHYVYTRWPNKLLNLLVWLRIIKLDKLCHCEEELARRRSNLTSSLSKDYRLPEIASSADANRFPRNDRGIDTWFSPNLSFINLSKNVRHIQTIHDLSFEFLPDCFTWKQRLWHKFLNPQRQCQRANVIITPSENTKRDVIDRYQIAESKLQVLRPGLPFIMTQNSDSRNQVKQRYGLPEKYILYLGTLEPRKNVQTIIEAFCNSELRTQKYELVIAGGKGWKNKKLMQLIKETSGVRYIGYVDERDKPTLYKLSSLFVFISLYEGFGLPVLEAMVSGVPVITSSRSSLPEVVGEAGYLINPHNVDELAEAIKKILSDEKLRGVLVERGKKRIEEFGCEKLAVEFIKIINSGV